jgi:hypothetical protein
MRVEPDSALWLTRGRRVAMAAGVALFSLTLVGQGLYYYRGDIVARMPELRAPLERACAALRCSVTLPQRPQDIIIEATDMRAIDPNYAGRILLTATLRSHATSIVGYPVFDVALTDVQNQTLARRIFMPSEYLEPGKDIRSGIAPNAEVATRLDLDSGDLAATGFRIELLAAPEN